MSCGTDTDSWSSSSSDRLSPDVKSTSFHHQHDADLHYGMMTPVNLQTEFNTDLTVSVTQRMELVWNAEFIKLFGQFQPDQWSLTPVLNAPPTTDDMTKNLNLFKDSAKVRFICQSCGNCWTSMKGRVLFWYALIHTDRGRHGFVQFKLYGQKCTKCHTERIEEALWYPEEVIKVVGNVYNRVGQMYYGFQRPPLCISRRQGKPQQRHNSEACGACQDGVCQKEWEFKESNNNSSAPVRIYFPPNMFSTPPPTLQMPADVMQMFSVPPPPLQMPAA